MSLDYVNQYLSETEKIIQDIIINTDNGFVYLTSISQTGKTKDKAKNERSLNQRTPRGKFYRLAQPQSSQPAFAVHLPAGLVAEETSSLPSLPLIICSR